MGGAFGKKKAKIIHNFLQSILFGCVIVGLDNSGKTTLINYLKPPKEHIAEVTPTVGFKVESFKQEKINFTWFDMSGQGIYRSLWPEYYSEAQGVIFVIDSADKLRIAVAKNELELMMEDPGIRDRPVPILFFANKKDLPYALSEAEIAKEFELDNISDRDWHIEASNALTGDGVSDGIQWLAKKLPKSKK